MSSSISPQVLQELSQFLSPDARPDLKKTALVHVLGATGMKEGIQLIRDNLCIFESLVSLTKDKSDDIIHNSYQCLVNLCAESDFALMLLDSSKYPNFSGNNLKYVLDAKSKHADMACKLLNNLTHHERGAQIISEMVFKQPDDFGLDKFFQVFCDLNFNTNANLHYLGGVLANLSQIREVRVQFMDSERFMFQKLLPFIKYNDSVLRKKGVVRTVRNCCFDTDYHDWLLSDDVDILPYLLLPLAGPEEFDEDDMEKLPDDLQYLPPDKEREPDADIRRMLIESVHQLCALRKGRQFIKDKNTYIIMRELHKWENDKANDKAIFNLIDLLIGDEPPDDMQNLKSVDIPSDVMEKIVKAGESE